MSKVKKSTHTEDISSSSSKSSSPSSDEEIDARDLKPIKDYLPNRRELARQLFKSVKTEKIRMMLPQVLKRIDLKELEDWCANELNGMSKARIMCILNGETMLESSDTCESDDSGPSLEIISDTEEWFSDDNILKKCEGEMSASTKKKDEKAKLKEKSHVRKRADVEKLKIKSKLNYKNRCDSKHGEIKIKTEEKKETNKEKEGDSLLDLLELEMRARAIRALIRKEEDVIPSSNTSKTIEADMLNENNSHKNTRDELKEKENCRLQLERIISAQQVNNVDDEDVVLVTQPTPTIELLSSDSESESNNGIRINKKLENERTVEMNVDVDPLTNRVESKQVEQSKEIHRESDTSKLKISKRIHSNSVEANSIRQSLAEKLDTGVGKKRKVKKKSHSKEEVKACTIEETSTKLKRHSDTQHTGDEKHTEHSSVNCTVENVDSVKESEETETKPMVNVLQIIKCDSLEENNTVKEVSLDEEKSMDLEEIIDLDNYCDDMDDIENFENDEAKKSQASRNEQRQNQRATCSEQKASTETWASRYYQTDDVQNVIRESKIQSEIRKRLRERQRLFKLNKSPNSNTPSTSPATENMSNKLDDKTTGSVNEYLALKRIASVNLSASNSSNGINVAEDGNVSSDTHSHDTMNVETDIALTHPKEHAANKNTLPDKDLNIEPLLNTKAMDTIETNTGIKPG